MLLVARYAPFMERPDHGIPDWVREHCENPELPLPEHMQGLELSGDWAWQLQGSADPLECILRLPGLLGPDAVLCIEAVGVAKEVQEFFAAHSVKDPVKIAHDTIWPQSSVWQIPLTSATVEQFAAIYRTRADGLPDTAYLEVGDHLKAYRENVLLLHWHDAFLDGTSILVSQSISEESVRTFCSGLQREYSKTPLGKSKPEQN